MNYANTYSILLLRCSICSLAVHRCIECRSACSCVHTSYRQSNRLLQYTTRGLSRHNTRIIIRENYIFMYIYTSCNFSDDLLSSAILSAVLCCWCGCRCCACMLKLVFVAQALEKRPHNAAPTVRRLCELVLPSSGLTQQLAAVVSQSETFYRCVTCLCTVSTRLASTACDKQTTFRGLLLVEPLLRACISLFSSC
jgi:hypothetical protein